MRPERLRIDLAGEGSPAEELDIRSRKQMVIRGRQKRTDPAPISTRIAARQFPAYFRVDDGMAVLGADAEKWLRQSTRASEPEEGG